MENKTITNFDELRENWCEWMSGRVKGNFYKMLGGSGNGESVRPSRVAGSSMQGNQGRPVITCFLCGEAGHRAVDCRAKKSTNDHSVRPSSSSPKPRPWTCYICNKEGHRSYDCPTKKVGQ